MKLSKRTAVLHLPDGRILENIKEEADRIRQQNKLLSDLTAAEAQAEKLDAQTGEMELAEE